MSTDAVFRPKPVHTYTLWMGKAVVGITVPAGLRTIRELGRRPFIPIARSVTRGVVWLYLHDPTGRTIDTLPGTRVAARLDRVIGEVYKDVRPRLYANLTVVPPQTAQTHELIVHSSACDFKNRQETEYMLPVDGTDGVFELRRKA